MLVKLQTVQEVQKTLLIEDKRHTNMNVESSRVNFSPRLGLICGHSTFTMKRSIDLLNNGKNGNQLLFSVSVHNTGLYKKTKKCFILSKNNGVCKTVKLGISKRPSTCIFFLPLVKIKV